MCWYVYKDLQFLFWFLTNYYLQNVITMADVTAMVFALPTNSMGLVLRRINFYAAVRCVSYPIVCLTNQYDYKLNSLHWIIKNPRFISSVWSLNWSFLLGYPHGRFYYTFYDESFGNCIIGGQLITKGDGKWWIRF
jgi:hypothetical protein